MTILALILARIRQNFKVDMYAEITKVKKLTTAQFDNDVQLHFDTVQFLKIQIDQKDPNAYTEEVTFVMYSFSSSMTLSLRNSDSNLLVKKLVG